MQYVPTLSIGYMATIQTTPSLWQQYKAHHPYGNNTNRTIPMAYAHVVIHQTVAVVQYVRQEGLLVPSVMVTLAVSGESGSLITLLYADDDGISRSM